MVDDLGALPFSSVKGFWETWVNLLACQMRYLWETGVKPLFAVVSLRPLVDHRALRASPDTCEAKLCLRRNEQSEHVPWMCPHYPSHSKEAAPRPAC